MGLQGWGLLIHAQRAIHISTQGLKFSIDFFAPPMNNNQDCDGQDCRNQEERETKYLQERVHVRFSRVTSLCRLSRPRE